MRHNPSGPGDALERAAATRFSGAAPRPAAMPHDSSRQTAPRNAEDKPARKPRPSFGRLAQRIAAWTSSLLVSAIILVAGLVSGRQVLHWWRDDPPGARALPGAHEAPPAAPADSAGDWQKLEVGGGQWSMSVRSVAGDRTAAEKELRRACKAATATATLPGEPALRAERALVARLGPATLIETTDAGWELHALADAPPDALADSMPMVAVVRRAASIAGSQTPTPPAVAPAAAPAAASAQPLRPSASAPSQTPSHAEQSSQAVTYVAIWGLAIPAGPKRWTAYLFQPTHSKEDTAAAAPADIPVPPGATKLLALSSTAGGAMVSFQGPAEPDAWKRTFDRWLADGGWQAPQGWRSSGNGWYLRGQHAPALAPAASAAPAARAGAVIDIRFSPDPKGGFAGIVVVTPGAAKPTESSGP